MISLLISILLSLGIISSQDEYYDLSQQEQEHYQETIINEDINGI